MGIWWSRQGHHEKQVTLVTGASSGIGLTCALDLLQRGHVVYGAARRVELMDPIAKAGGHVLAMDVTNSQDVERAVATILKEQGRIDVLVNNAGFSDYGPVEDLTMSEGRRLFDVNFFGMVHCTGPFVSWYAASKHAMEGWSDSLRVEVKQFGIDIVIVEPGFIQTDIVDKFLINSVQRSKGGPYELSMNKTPKNSQEIMSKAASPHTVAKAVIQATEARRPKRRYVMGFLAFPFLWVRTWLGDAVFDAVAMAFL